MEVRNAQNVFSMTPLNASVLVNNLNIVNSRIIINVNPAIKNHYYNTNSLA